MLDRAFGPPYSEILDPPLDTINIMSVFMLQVFTSIKIDVNHFSLLYSVTYKETSYIIVGKIQGKDLLDVGCGPSILFSIVPSQYFENVYLSDYLERNVKTIQTWLDDRPEQVDLQPFIEFAGKYVDKR